MKTTNNLTLMGLAVLLSAGTSLAANANSKNASTANPPTQAAGAAAGSTSSDAAGNAAPAAGSAQEAPKPAVALGIGKNGVSVNLNGGMTFGKSMLGKLFQNK